MTTDDYNGGIIQCSSNCNQEKEIMDDYFLCRLNSLKDFTRELKKIANFTYDEYIQSLDYSDEEYIEKHFK